MSSPLFDNFGEWMRPVSASSPARFVAAKATAEAMADNNAANYADLVELAFGRPSDHAAGRIHDAMVEHDASYVGRSGDRQTQVIACGVIARKLEQESWDAGYTATVVRAAAFGGSTPVVGGLLEYAERREQEIADVLRSLPTLPSLSITRVFKDIEVGAIGAESAEIAAVYGSVKSLAGVVQRHEKACRAALDQRMKVSNEELDMLWWALGGAFGGGGQAFAENPEAAPVLAGCDLAGLTRFSSPIRATPGLLRRVVSDPGRLVDVERTLRTAAELHKDWGKFDHGLTPLVSSLQSLAVDPEKPTIVRTLAPQTRLDIAVQVVREQLLLREQ